MRSQIGPRGVALLLAAAVLGAVLAAHGWAERRLGLAPGALAVPGATSSPSARSSGPARPSGPTTSPTAASPGPGASPGPALSSQSFAPYSYLIWPGTPGAAGRAAMTGLSIAVHRAGHGISVSAGVLGQPAPAPHVYPQGAKVYVVETTLGDDSGSSDYNLGDDGLVVTDANGRILQ